MTPPQIREERDQAIISRYAAGESYAAIAKALSCGTSTINNVIGRAVEDGLVKRRDGRRNAERDTKVLALRREGKTFGQIAEIMDLSRSAVAGIIGRNSHVLPKKPRRTPPVARDTRPKQSKRQFDTPRPKPKPRAEVITTPPAARPVIVPHDSVSLRDAGADQCRWPLWERDLPKEPHVCGAPVVEGLSWCPAHLARVTAAKVEREAA